MLQHKNNESIRYHLFKVIQDHQELVHKNDIKLLLTQHTLQIPGNH